MPAMEGIKVGQRRSRIAGLDGLRALAVTVVFVHHADIARFPGGFLGVDLFFALSGYLITDLLLSEHSRSGRINLKWFYWRRFLRLSPALVTMLLVMTPITIAALGAATSLKSAGTALVYLEDIYAPFATNSGPFGHAWSLSVEEQFYLVWPASLIYVMRRKVTPIATAAGVALLSVLVTALLENVSAVKVLYFFPTTHLPVIAGGAVLALALRSETIRARVTPIARQPLLFALLGAAFVLAALKLQESNRGLYYGGFAVLAVVALLMVAHLLVTPEGFWSKVLGWRPLAFVGERSYAVYLWHYPIILVLQHRGTSVNRTLVIAAVATAVAAELSWVLVETPFNRMKDRRGSDERQVAEDVLAASNAQAPLPKVWVVQLLAG